MNDHDNRQRGRRWLRRAAAIGAGGVAVAAGLLWALCVVMVLESRLSSDTADDPHGYGLIFGTVLAIPAATVTAAALPWAVPRRRRARVARLTTSMLLVSIVILLVALFTA
ncbi:hypothetical protein [Nocardia amikacinitolerans]|uniref:hypothetical protein n=1 Tax=Nocardia amikacinitolerans TaxID=756689 RepID=UPI0020A445F4|nr:hypothetical protein [Nocardia amikacinitolerans]MCP2280922.1 hypothetical protein [Nocardia amikacinitolerans]